MPEWQSLLLAGTGSGGIELHARRRSRPRNRSGTPRHGGTSSTPGRSRLASRGGAAEAGPDSARRSEAGSRGAVQATAPLARSRRASSGFAFDDDLAALQAMVVATRSRAVSRSGSVADGLRHARTSSVSAGQSEGEAVEDAGTAGSEEGPGREPEGGAGGDHETGAGAEGDGATADERRRRRSTLRVSTGVSSPQAPHGFGGGPGHSGDAGAQAGEVEKFGVAAFQRGSEQRLRRHSNAGDGVAAAAASAAAAVPARAEPGHAPGSKSAAASRAQSPRHSASDATAASHGGAPAGGRSRPEQLDIPSSSPSGRTGIHRVDTASSAGGLLSTRAASILQSALQSLQTPQEIALSDSDEDSSDF